MTVTTNGQPPRRLACARCGMAFDCNLSADCWCAAEAYRLPMTKAWLEDCLCPACLRKAATSLAESHRTAEDESSPRTDAGPARRR